MYAAAYVWGKILARLEQELGEPAFTQVTERTGIHRMSEDTLVIYTDTFVQKEILTEWCAPAMEAVLEELGMTSYRVLTGRELYLHCIQGFVHHGEELTLESFLEGSSNTHALACVRDIACGKKKGLFYLNGPSGVGKTHLLRGLQNAVYQQRFQANVIYTTGEEMVAHLIWSLRNLNREEFVRRYGRCDVLLVDDVQFLAGRGASFEHIMEVVQQLLAEGKTVVMSGDRTKQQLQVDLGAAEEISIAPPDEQLRLGALTQRAQEMGLALDEATKKLLVDTFRDNLKQQEGALRRIRAFHDLENLELTYQNVLQILDGILS